MFLKSLELNGFKSFAQKTVLEFPGGITGIVGPNGSGKSNIIDCIRWLLGEREAKNLRGAKVEDLIWNGTPKRPRVSLAQAGLNFDNSSGFFPIDYKEVLVSRKISRDGNSQYFLNKSEVRLKDIVDFMSRSRLGTKGLTIIGQGSSDLFVRAAPEERRMMIEEILGLREFQVKKIEAERKLKNTSFNIEKVKAMIEEVAPRLRLLKRQTNKWSKRTALKDELIGLENNYFAFKLGIIKNQEEELKPIIAELSQKITLKEKEVHGLEAELKKIESQPKEYEEIKKIKEERNALLRQKSEIEKELGRLEAKIEFLSSRPEEKNDFEKEELVGLISEVKKELARGLVMENISEIKNAVKFLIEKIEKFIGSGNKADKGASELGEIEKAKTEIFKKFEAIEAGIKDLDKKESGITAGLEKFNEQFQKSYELIEKRRGELREIEEKKNKVFFDREKLTLRLEELKNRIGEIGRAIRDFENLKTSKFSEEELSQMEKRMLRLRGELASIGEIDEGLIKEAEEVEAHYSFLTNQSQDLDEASVHLRGLIKELSEKITSEFSSSLKLVNDEFSKFFRLMFGGGSAKLKLKKQETRSKNHEEKNKELEAENPEEKLIEPEEKEEAGIDIELSLPRKRITGLEMLSGGERSLVSIAALFSLISVSPPPFLVLDEIDAALDENNSKRFANLIREFSKKTQFVVATHNRATMEAADVLYGITMGDDGASKVLSLKLEG